MQKDERDLLDVLKRELDFFTAAGYTRSSWKPKLIFEDSSTCINCDSKDNRKPCTECALIDLVPAEHRSSAVPCRHIPLNAAGETLDSLYRYADRHEVEKTVVRWLEDTIESLEEERAASSKTKNQQPSSSEGTRVDSLYQHLHPKCANPACSSAFHWLAGGRFFRFRADAGLTAAGTPADADLEGHRGTKHYWLCEPCSRVFALTYEEKEGGVLLHLKPLRLQLPIEGSDEGSHPSGDGNEGDRT